MSGGAVGWREPMVCAQLTSVACTLMRWEMAAGADQPTSALLAADSDRGSVEEPTMPRPLPDYLKAGVLPGGSHHFDVGQPGPMPMMMSPTSGRVVTRS